MLTYGFVTTEDPVKHHHSSLEEMVSFSIQVKDNEFRKIKVPLDKVKKIIDYIEPGTALFVEGEELPMHIILAKTIILVK